MEDIRKNKTDSLDQALSDQPIKKQRHLSNEEEDDDSEIDEISTSFAPPKEDLEAELKGHDIPPSDVAVYQFNI
jgi:hypothetical protein